MAPMAVQCARQPKRISGAVTAFLGHPGLIIMQGGYSTRSKLTEITTSFPVAGNFGGALFNVSLLPSFSI
jgi:hypothetical protein